MEDACSATRPVLELSAMLQGKEPRPVTERERLVCVLPAGHEPAKAGLRLIHETAAGYRWTTP